MENKKWLAAPLAGLLAAGLHFKYVYDMKNEVTGGDKVEVLSLAADVASGDKIQKTALASRMIPASYVDDRSVRINKLTEVVGMAAAVNLKAGQTLLWTDFEARTGAADLADLLEPGLRAMTIPVDSSISMGGLLRPGHRVDIMCTFGTAIGQEKHTATLLQNVTVLAVGRTVGDADEVEVKSAFKTITLGVALEDAERLALAARQGVLSVALRGRQDLAVIQNVPRISASELIAPSAPPKAKLPAESLRSIERIQRR